MKLVSGDILSKTVTTSITLGSTGYPSPLAITTTGAVAPSTASGASVVSTVKNNSLTNNGRISGAAGASGTVGQAGFSGVNFAAAGTVINTGSIAGGAGGTGSAGAGGVGGAGVRLNGTLTTSGTISGGAGGHGSTSSGAMGDAVEFGPAASTLIVDPGAVFHGLVVANAAVNDVLELAGKQSGGTALTLGTQFTNFSTLDFASAASGTVDATKAALTVTGSSADHRWLCVGRYPRYHESCREGRQRCVQHHDRDAEDHPRDDHDQPAVQQRLHGRAFRAQRAAGSGTDVSLASGADATLAGLSHEVMNFVSDYHRAFTDGRIMPAHGLASSLLPTASAAASDHMSVGIASLAYHEHGVAHVAPACARRSAAPQCGRGATGWWKLQLGRSHSAAFLAHLSIVAQRDTLHLIAKLHDPAKQFGQNNLSIGFIIDNGFWGIERRACAWAP